MILRTVAIGAVICAAWAVNAGAQGHKERGDSTSTEGAPLPKAKTRLVLKEQALPQKVTIKGEVIDATCFLRHGDRGETHSTCAGYCAAQGMPFGILDSESDQVYLALPLRHYNPAETMARYLDKTVKVTGPIYSWGGLRGIETQEVEEVMELKEQLEMGW